MSAHESRAPHRLRLPREEERRPRARPLAAVGEPALRACLRQERTTGARLEGQAEAEYPKTTKVVEAPGKKAAERLLETWIAELMRKGWRTACRHPVTSAGRTQPRRTPQRAGRPDDRPAPADPRPPGLVRRHGSTRYGVKQCAESRSALGPGGSRSRHYVRLTTSARAKAVAGLDEVTRAALERPRRRPSRTLGRSRDNVIALASRRR